MSADQYAIDLKVAAHHEAGHLIVAAFHGVDGWIELSDAVAPGKWDKLVTARIGFDSEFHTDAAERQMALAGLMAEEILSGASWEEIEEQAPEWVFSESDGEAAEGWTEDDLRETHRVLVEQWEEVVAAAALATKEHLTATGRVF